MPIGAQTHCRFTVSGSDSGEPCQLFFWDSSLGEQAKPLLDVDGPDYGYCIAEAVISANGSTIAFESQRSDLVAGDANSTVNVFALKVATGKVALVSKTPFGGSGNGASYQPSISADGRYVAFGSRATNLILGRGVPSRRRVPGRPGPASMQLVGADSSKPSISASGGQVAFRRAIDSGSGYSTYLPRVFVRDMSPPGPITTVPSPNSEPWYSIKPILSGSGRYLIYQDLNSSGSGLLRSLVVRDLDVSTYAYIAPTYQTGYPDTASISISADGTKLSFVTEAKTVITPPDSDSLADLFVHTLP